MGRDDETPSSRNAPTIKCGRLAVCPCKLVIDLADEVVTKPSLTGFGPWYPKLKPRPSQGLGLGRPWLDQVLNQTGLVHEILPHRTRMECMPGQPTSSDTSLDNVTPKLASQRWRLHLRICTTWLRTPAAHYIPSWDVSPETGFGD